MKESRINVRIPPDKKDAFQKKVESQGKKVTDVVLEMIEQYLQDETPVHVTDLAKRLEKLEQKILGESAA
ncbi:MAG: hypothetical protein PUP91_32315 [Rhizonema sp. PD37]|nr:hypothetical protein [Rhizonema sp. PD37]